MRIVLIGGQEIPSIGGAEAYMLNLARSLYAKGHHDVTVICSARESREFELEGISIVYIVCPKNNFIALPLLFFKSLVWIIKNRKDIDLVNYQSVIWAFIPGWISYLAGCKVCYTIHSLAEDNSKYNAFMRLLIKINTFLSIWLCNKNIFTVSYSKAREIKQRYGKKSSVVPCGVYLPTEIQTTNILDKFGLRKNEYYFYNYIIRYRYCLCFYSQKQRLFSCCRVLLGIFIFNNRFNNSTIRKR
jgi:glycosyltransferase involved in cell wall biosynthesis